MTASKLTLISDIGGTNARMALVDNKKKTVNEKVYLHQDYEGLEQILEDFIKVTGEPEFQRGILGVAAPIIGDEVNFVNANLSFSQKNLEDKFFKHGLVVLNDLELQVLALNSLTKEDVTVIGEQQLNNSTKILISPGTGLGLAGLVKGTPVATESGHINIPHVAGLESLIQSFKQKKGRTPTFEDLLSGKGILFLNEFVSNEINGSVTSEQALMSNTKEGQEVREIFSVILAIFCRFSALMWGSKGGVYLSGSIINSLIEQINLDDFRDNFEDSQTMKDLLLACPIIHVKNKNLGFIGAKTLIK